MKNIKTNFTLNDSGDILVRVRPTREYSIIRKKHLENLEAFDESSVKDESNAEFQDKIYQCSIYLYLPSAASAPYFSEYMYFDSETDELYDIQGTSMNERFIFFWNDGIVWSLSLET